MRLKRSISEISRVELGQEGAPSYTWIHYHAVLLVVIGLLHPRVEGIQVIELFSTEASSSFLDLPRVEGASRWYACSPSLRAVLLSVFDDQRLLLLVTN
jgi:hypothetical protein